MNKCKKQTDNNDTKYYKHILDNMKIKDEQILYIKVLYQNDKEKDAKR